MKYEIKKVDENNWELYMSEQLVKSSTTLFDVVTTIKAIETNANVEFKEG